MNHRELADGRGMAFPRIKTYGNYFLQYSRLRWECLGRWNAIYIFDSIKKYSLLQYDFKINIVLLSIDFFSQYDRISIPQKETNFSEDNSQSISLDRIHTSNRIVSLNQIENKPPEIQAVSSPSHEIESVTLRSGVPVINHYHMTPVCTCTKIRRAHRLTQSRRPSTKIFKCKEAQSRVNKVSITIQEPRITFQGISRR